MLPSKRTNTKKFRCSDDLIDAINILKDQGGAKTSESDVIHRAVSYYLRNFYRGKQQDEVMALAHRL